MNFYGDNVRHWVGVVKEKVDETYVKVRIFGIHPLEESELSSSDLPLAVVLYPTTGAQMGFGSVSHNLEPDTWVMGISLDDSFMQPIITGVIQGTDYSMSTASSGGGAFVGDQSYDEQGNPQVDTGATTNIPGGSNVEKAYNYVYSKLQSEGSSSDPHLHAAALVGVLRLETTGVNPAVVGGYKGRAWGICQWLGPRRKQLFAKYGRTKRLDHQLDFMWWELNYTPERKAKNRWLSATNLPDAVDGFAGFERNENWNSKKGRVNRGHPNYSKQLKYAYEVFNSISHTAYPQNNTPYRGPQ